MIGSAICQFCHTYRLSLQSIESILRRVNAFTYLIAKKPSKEFFHAELMLHGQGRQYNTIISTRDIPLVLEEILEESTSYRDNNEKLKDAGFAMQNKNIWKFLNFIINEGCEFTEEGLKYFTDQYKDMKTAYKNNSYNDNLNAINKAGYDPKKVFELMESFFSLKSVSLTVRKIASNTFMKILNNY